MARLLEIVEELRRPVSGISARPSSARALRTQSRSNVNKSGFRQGNTVRARRVRHNSSNAPRSLPYKASRDAAAALVGELQVELAPVIALAAGRCFSEALTAKLRWLPAASPRKKLTAHEEVLTRPGSCGSRARCRSSSRARRSQPSTSPASPHPPSRPPASICGRIGSRTATAAPPSR